ncbi:hypothetical protein [Terribacillus aidingensis]|nr:hypothetical protein [Terribacillus aidingensis]
MFNQSRNQLDSTVTNIPPAYLTLNALTKLHEYFANGRADSLKEALNLYEAEKQHHAHLQALSDVKIMQEEMIRVTNENNRLQWMGMFRR